MNLLDFIDAPMSLSGGYVALSSTASASYDSSRFQNDTRLPLLLTGIRFDTKTTSGPDPRPYIGVNVQMGQIALTEQFCTLALLSESTNSLIPSVTGLSPTTSSFVTDEFNSALWGTAYWKFPRPMFYPPDMGLAVQAQLFAQPNTLVGTTMDVTLYGYYLKPCPFPKEIAAPWAATWDVARTNNSTRVVPVDKWSPETRFKNQFQSPLFLQSLTGRLYTTDASTPATYAAAGLTESRSGDYAFVEINRTGADSVDLVNDLTPWWQVFDPRTFKWQFKNWALQPREYLSIRATASGAYPFVGMRGYRHEALTT